VFKASLREARKRAKTTHPLVIGDGLETDILGANRLSLDALFISGGIHSAEFRDNPSALGDLLASSGAHAIGVMPALMW